jgi:3-oxoacyl-[acyl-carrier protein] reductase
MHRRDRLAGRTAVVTGGSRGIGAAISKAFVAEGAAVAIVHLDDEDNARRTLESLRSVDARCVSMSCDVTNQQQVNICLAGTRRELGGPDILVNCAGIGVGARFEDTTLDHWNQVLGVNLTGAYLMTRYCYPLMKERGWGRIINIASQMAFCGCVGAAAYCASKAGLIGMTRSLALEAAPFGVLVNCIAPGATVTDMLNQASEEEKAALLRRIPLGRFARAEEIAPTAVLLASEDGAFYVGQTLSPNGGDVLR